MTSCFIVTRFNLALYHKDKENNLVRTDEWLDDRFRLFETYCVPSVRNQTYQNFCWIVLFSAQTPDKYKFRIEKICNNFPQFVVLYIDDDEIDAYHSQVKEQICKLKDDTNLLVTIRIDNDDAISVDYVERAMKLAESQRKEKQGYSFVYGIQYHEKVRLAVRVPYPNNHFIFEVNTAFYAEQPFDYILEYNHAEVNQMPFPFEYSKEKKVMWAEVIHGRNVDNDVKKTIHQKPIFQRDFLIKTFAWNFPIKTLHSVIAYMLYLPVAAVLHAIQRIKQRFCRR